MGHPVVHFEINAKDAKAAQRFYGEVFGWSIDTNNPMDYGMVDTRAGGKGINGGIGASQEARSWLTFYVDTPNPAETLAKAERLGARTLMPPTDMGPVTVALFADPEGNVIGLTKSQAPRPARRSSARRNGATRSAASSSRTRRATRKPARAARSTARTRGRRA
ncbi:MAG TPA: VOC family protein [Candidatus Dormibacteraeota bacterium]|jgi:predicted enzyme related to lactoylglutathione lyase|nr:VOC family protein [Candidatus Dormibacteraeota bacterium]